MKKRILSVLLTICMVLTFVPTTVFAESVGDKYELLNILKKGGTQKLNKDYVCVSCVYSVEKDITLDLNGHVIQLTGGISAGYHYFNVGNNEYPNKTLTIIDSDPDNTHTGQFEGLPAGGVIVGPSAGAVSISEGSTFNLKGGTLYNCKITGKGGGVHNKGTFNMSGGTIDGCTASDKGGGVYNEGTFNMSGGYIDRCGTREGGGVANSGNFIMDGGTVDSCVARFGGGAANYEGGTFTMNGGIIQNCDASNSPVDEIAIKDGSGGAMYISGGTGNMKGGTIKNCEAVKYGGGVTVKSQGIFNMSGGTIESCSAVIFGGGIYSNTSASTTLDGGTVDGCSADYGGGVFAHDSSFIMNSGTIKNCRATTSEGSYGFGGGVNLYYSNFTMTGGTIRDCSATYGESGALCLFANSTMTANGGSVQGTTVIDSLDGSISRIQSTSSDKYTRFYGEVENEGVISGGVYYGGIQNKYDGTVTGTCYTVSFDSNGGSAVPTQRFVNISTATALRPTNPTRRDYVFKGWYNGSTQYTFTEPVTKSITLTAEWINTNVSTETDLKQLIDGGIPSIKLADDITLSSILDLSDKEFTLDLNGHVLKGNIKLSDSINPINPSKLTLIDSNPTATHTDSTLPLGGVLDGDIKLDKKTFGTASLLYANGGTVMGKVMLNDSSTQIGCTNNTPTAFMDGVEGSGEIHGGMFYGGVKESCIEEEIVTFLSDGQRYAVGVVESRKYAVAPVDPVKDGYVFAGWYIGNTKYDFIQPVMLDVVLNAKWVIDNVSSEDKLREALDLGSTFIKLQSDIKLSSALDLSQKDITIDLNGYVISGADISINTGNGKASLTLTDSRPTARHTDSTLPLGGVVTSKISMKQSGGSYNDCVLYANGGTVTSEFNTNTNAVAIKCTSNTPTAFTGKISGHTHLYGGIYYGTIGSTVTMEGKKITFQNGNSTYAYEIADGNKTVSPIVPPIKTGYQAFDGWYNGNTKYTFGSALSEDITLTAKYGNPLTYNISYALDGGTASNPATYTVESAAITLNNPTKPGYTFTGWSGTGLTGQSNMTVTIPQGSTGERAYTAHWSDATAPVISGIENGKTYCGPQTVTVSDNDGIASVTVNGSPVIPDTNGRFTLNTAAGTQTVVAIDNAGNDTTVTVTVNNGHTAGNDDGDCSTPVYCIYHPDTVVVAAKSHDFSGEWNKDENGHWHICQNDGCTVADTKTPHSGTDDGDCTTAVICECGYVITAANAEHAYEWQDDNGQYWKKCKFCGDETAKKEIPTVTINGADAVCITQDYKFRFTLPQGATDPVYGYEFENKGDIGLPAIIENNELFGMVPVTEYEPSENSFKVLAGAKTADGFEFFASKTVALKSEHTDAEPKDHICDICGETISQHSGGEATCTRKAICAYCGSEYGELDSSKHDLETIPAKDATVTETGNKAYWHCKDCGKYFADKNGENEIELNDTVIPKLPPEIIAGKGQSITAGEKKALTFRSNAAYSDFIRVALDGKTLDEKNYTVKEGSTVVTLKADYVATLSAGEHTIGIVSTNGTAATTLTVNAKPANNNNSPQTGDNSHMALWIALLFVSGGLLTVTGIYGKRKTRSEN